MSTPHGLTALLTLAALALLAPASIASAQGVGTLSPAGHGYTWTRGQLRFELRNRHATWSQRDATRVAQSLDKLPDVLLNHAMRLGVVKLHRDDVPRKRLGLKSGGIATTVVDAKSISFGDVLFQRSDARVYQTVTHEFGHVAQYAITGRNVTGALIEVLLRGSPGFTNVSWTSGMFSSLRSHNGFVSDYARTNNREDFAESVEFYWINPDELLRANPAKFRFMRDQVFNQVSSPASSRDLTHRAIGPVVPLIQQLSKQRAAPLGMVRVRGRYIMGPIDGGFNRVTFGPKKALHLPLSRQSILTWVPFLGQGPAPVQVQTQDGTSAPLPFEVKKPWWKFW